MAKAMPHSEFGFLVLSLFGWIHSCTEIMVLPLWIIARWPRQNCLFFDFCRKSSLCQAAAPWRRQCPTLDLIFWSSLGLVGSTHALKSCFCHCGSLHMDHGKVDPNFLQWRIIWQLSNLKQSDENVSAWTHQLLCMCAWVSHLQHELHTNH